MGVLDYSRGAFVGKVGVHYGQKGIGSNQLKKIPLKAAPQNRIQTSSVRAFEKLNRFASALAKIGWKWLGLSDKKMLKHNAVAHFLKPLVSEHVYNLNNFAEIASQDNTVHITSFVRSADASSYTIEANVDVPISKADGKVWFVFIFDKDGTAVFSECPDSDSISRIVPVNPHLLESFSALAFRLERVPGRARWLGYDQKGGTLITGGRWYFQNSENPSGYYVENGKIYLVDPASRVESGKAYVR